MDFNKHVIEEFRANNGKVGGMFEGAHLILLTTAGARTGKPHTTPTVYLRDGNRYLVFGSNAGGPKHPHWYHNLLANPHLTVELGTEEGAVKPFAARAVVLEGEERDHYWELWCSRDPGFRASADSPASARSISARTRWSSERRSLWTWISCWPIIRLRSGLFAPRSRRWRAMTGIVPSVCSAQARKAGSREHRSSQ